MFLRLKNDGAGCWVLLFLGTGYWGTGCCCFWVLGAGVLGAGVLGAAVSGYWVLVVLVLGARVLGVLGAAGCWVLGSGARILEKTVGSKTLSSPRGTVRTLSKAAHPAI